jgi:hypothetical protein
MMARIINIGLLKCLPEPQLKSKLFRRHTAGSSSTTSRLTTIQSRGVLVSSLSKATRLGHRKYLQLILMVMELRSTIKVDPSQAESWSQSLNKTPLSVKLDTVILSRYSCHSHLRTNKTETQLCQYKLLMVTAVLVAVTSGAATSSSSCQ